MSLPKGWRNVPFECALRRVNSKKCQITSLEYQEIGALPVVDQSKEDIAGFTDQRQKRFPCPTGGVIVFGDHTRVVKYVDFDFVIGADGTQLMVAVDGVNTRFMLYQLQLNEVPDTGYNRHFKFLKERMYMLPPLPEQIEIARILGVWDAAIGDTTQLIAAKTQHKRGLMQQLLTGERRFDEFKGQAWQTRKLGELFSERCEANRPDLPLLSITGDRGVVPRDEIERKDSSNKDKKAYLRIAPGDIGYNTMRMWQGVSAVSPLEGIVSPAYTVCTPTDQSDAEFAGYLFKFGPMISLFHRHSQGMVADTLSLKYVHFARLKVDVPQIAEQRRIADVLDAATSEITLLQKQLDALKTQKRGLMQLLLSGEKSVAVANAGNLDGVARSNTGCES